LKCIDEGTLQAYLDSELPEARMRRAAGHLEGCVDCRGRLEQLQASGECVNAWLHALAPEDLAALDEAAPRIVTRPTRLHWRWAALTLAGALAASVALFLADTRPREKGPDVSKIQAPLTDTRGPISPVRYRAVRVKRRLRIPKPKPRPALGNFVALDDADPMQMGLVVRVMLPVSDASLTGGPQEIAADLMIGEDGRARAIRFVP
jgi:hypothetical protein